MISAAAVLTGSRPTDPPTDPELMMELAVVSERYRRFTAALPGVEVHFATKCSWCCR